LNASTLIRVVGTALVLSTLSFAAGIAGDLSMADPPNFGERVVVRIPPEIPADSARAAPLQPLLSTASAEARPSRFTPIRFRPESVALLVKPSGAQVLVRLPKENPVWLGKPQPLRRKGG
jgi:hypothetical protein